MEKVKTYKEQPSLQQQQPPPSPQPLQEQQQLTMPPLVENCVTTPDKLVKNDGDKSINEKTDVKWPVKRRISNSERRKRLNAKLGRFVSPKNALVVFCELFNGLQIQLQENLIDNVKSYTATLVIDGQVYNGNDISKTQAKKKACEKFLRVMLSNKLSEQSEKKEESPMNMEVEESDSVSKPEGLPQEDFPWSLFFSLAMYNLIKEWKIQPVESTVIKLKPKFLENLKNYNPIQLINLMKPKTQYTETIISANFPTLFQVDCLIDDDMLFIGQGSTKKAAKKESCIAAIKYLWKFDFHAIENN